MSVAASRGDRRPLSSTGKSILGLTGGRSSAPRDTEKERELATQTVVSASAASKSAGSRRITGQAGIQSRAQQEPAIGNRSASPADGIKDALALERSLSDLRQLRS